MHYILHRLKGSNFKPSGIRVNELQQIPNMQKAPGTVFHTSFTAILRDVEVEVFMKHQETHYYSTSTSHNC